MYRYAIFPSLALLSLSSLGCVEGQTAADGPLVASTTDASTSTSIGGDSLNDTDSADESTTTPSPTCPGCECLDGDVRPCDLEDAICAAAQECVTGVWGDCIPTEGDLEQCNGIDDDCMNGIDDGLIGCGGCELGLAEVCNGIDDDCDGAIDDGLDCECFVTGAESCNYLDDDCDGKIDEGVKNVCGGCGPLPNEVCNGKDDDCDGTVDEGVTNVCGVCGALPPEVCNGVDDDCDGHVDEGQLNTCGGCGPEPIEVCNGIDDDCNGAVDDGAPDCGLTVAVKPFVLNGNAAAKVELPFPYTSQIVPLVLIDEYRTNNNDYLFYAAACQPVGDKLVCDLAAGSEGNNTKIRGRVVLLGVGADGAVQSLAPWAVAQGDSNKLLGKLTLDGGHPLLGTILYDPGGDKDFGFRLTAAHAGAEVTYRGSGFYGDDPSMIAGYGHLVRFPAGVAVHDVYPVTVYNDKPVAISVQGVANPTAMLPLLTVTAYDTGKDDDVSWSIQCAPSGNDFTCTVAVTGGNSNSHVEVQGVLVGL